jgi:hypothetical protein
VSVWLPAASSPAAFLPKTYRVKIEHARLLRRERARISYLVVATCIRRASGKLGATCDNSESGLAGPRRRPSMGSLVEGCAAGDSPTGGQAERGAGHRNERLFYSS